MRIARSGCSPHLRVEQAASRVAAVPHERHANARHAPSEHWRTIKDYVLPPHVGLRFDRSSHAFECLRVSNVADAGLTVKYFDAAERRRCQVEFVNGKAHVDGSIINPQRGRSTSCNTWLIDPDRFAYVLGRTRAGNAAHLFIFKHAPGHIHHTSPLAGRNVLDAGFMSIRNGMIAYIENRSGHYNPAIEAKLHTLAILQRNGVYLNRVFVSERIEQHDVSGNNLIPDEDAIELAFSCRHALYRAADAHCAASFEGLDRVQSSDGEYDLVDKTRVVCREATTDF